MIKLHEQMNNQKEIHPTFEEGELEFEDDE
jgi:hypothetical protein